MALDLVSKLPYDHPYRWDGTLFGGPKLWRPDELGASLALWLDAEDAASITLNGSNVAQWDDKSGNGRHATQATAALQPAYSTTDWDGKPAIVFDGDGLGLAANLPTGSSIYFVSQRTGSAINQSLMGSSGAFDYLPIIGDSNISTNLFRFNNINDPADTSSYLNGDLIKAKNATPLITRDALFDLVAVKNVFAFLYILPFGQPPIIGYSAAGYQFRGPIVEVVCSTNDSSTEERQTIEGYLAWKWGFEADLPIGHPYKNTPPTV